MLRFYRGQSRQFRKESPVFLVPFANLSVHGTCHSDILTFDASLQLKKYKHPKKHVFLLVFFMFKKKKKRSTYIQHSHLFFPSKFGAWRSLLPYAAVGLEFPGWNGPQLHSCTDVARLPPK